jgi:hypothetical protein
LAVIVLQVLHQVVLFIHLIAFAMTLAAVLRADLRWLITRQVDAPRLMRTAQTVSVGLFVLWASGLTLVAMDVAASSAPSWAPSDKLKAKLFVVSLLTLNGWALHAWVFPRLPDTAVHLDQRWWPAVVLGAISSASWVYASFVGAARLVSPWLSFEGFMVLYGVALVASVTLAIAALRVSPTMLVHRAQMHR